MHLLPTIGVEQSHTSLEEEQVLLTNMKARAALLVLLFVASTIPFASAESETEVTINTDWTEDHAYIIKGEVELSQIAASHTRSGNALDVGLIYDTTGTDLRVILNTTISYGDEITITAGDTTRDILVGLWGQPMDDHEVTLNSDWIMDQQWENENGSQKYILSFNGQGWQQRIANSLDSWERGNGTLVILSNTGEGKTSMNVDLDSVWKNETTVDGAMTAQVFDARGNGIIEIDTNSDEGNLQIQGIISDAWINRSMIDNIIDERFRLEANGTISLLAEEDDGIMDLDGELAVLFIETWDSNGTRVLSHTEFEATADMMIENNDSRMDISLDNFESTERWEEGVRTDHFNLMSGHGSFGFSDSDDNASIQINGTVHDFHIEIEDGMMIVDDLHVDGRITGDAQGTFGVVRGIEQEATQTNKSGTMFDVVIVHQEEWFNVTGIAALPNSNLGAGAHHNESWSYDAKQADWDNRTIRTVWEQTGPDPSSGDIIHENSPLQTSPEQPTVEEAIGDVTVSRETGLSPITAQSGDVFTLDSQDGMEMTVTAGAPMTVQIDGHLVDTVYWTGIYSGEVYGSASGNLIVDGPLSGLNVEINRNFQIEFGEEGELVYLTENQSVNRVISPSIISIYDNTEPVIESISLAQGVVTGEGGAPGYLEVEVSDIDFNVESVHLDASSLGINETITLNDRGLDGDRIIGDDIWTTEISVKGLEFGELEINVTAIDVFTEFDSELANITVINQAPRLISFEAVPTILSRGEIMIINAEVIDGHGVSSVSVDFREYGGNMTELNRVGELWIGQVEIPIGMSPGKHIFKIRMIDGEGSSIIVERTSASGQHHEESSTDEDLEVTIQNEAPTINVGETRIIEIGDEEVEYTLTIEVSDPDGLFWVKVNLDSLAPPGQSKSWLSMTSNNDGTYSIKFTVKTYIALGTYEIRVKAMDSYESQSGEESLSITLQAPNDEKIDSSQSNILTLAAVIGLGILVIIGAIAYVMRGSNKEGGFGGFGEV